MIDGLGGDGRGAPLPWRVLAYAADLALVVLVVLLDPPLGTVAGVAVVVNVGVLPIVAGRTVGMALTRLRYVPVVEGVAYPEQRGVTALTGLGLVTTQWLCVPASALVWAVTWDRDRRNLIDRVTKTAVVQG